MRKREINKLALLYIISMVIAFATRIGNITISYKPALFIGLIWILIAVKKMNTKSGLNHDVDAKNLLKLYLIPHIAIHLYTVVLMIFGKVEWKYLGTNATVYIPVLLVIASVCLFGKKSLYYNITALIFSWIVCAIASTILIGPHIVLDAIRQAYFGVQVKNYLEIHDLVLAVGYIVVYYMFSEKKLDKRNKIVLGCCVGIMLFSMKRIVLGAIVICLIFKFIMSKVENQNKYKVCLIFGILGFVACYLFIYLLSPGSGFYQFLNDNPIFLSGRNYFYEVIMGLSRFSVDYVGIGRNVVTQLLTTQYAFLKVGGVHSDIIKMYVENGFIMFGLWLWYYLIYIPKVYNKEHGIKACIMYLAITIYAFMLYVTDNIEIYFICQIFQLSIPIVFAMGLDKWGVQGINHEK